MTVVDGLFSPVHTELHIFLHQELAKKPSLAHFRANTDTLLDWWI